MFCAKVLKFLVIFLGGIVCISPARVEDAIKKLFSKPVIQTNPHWFRADVRHWLKVKSQLKFIEKIVTCNLDSTLKSEVLNLHKNLIYYEEAIGLRFKILAEEKLTDEEVQDFSELCLNMSKNMKKFVDEQGFKETDEEDEYNGRCGKLGDDWCCAAPPVGSSPNDVKNIFYKYEKKFNDFPSMQALSQKELACLSSLLVDSFHADYLRTSDSGGTKSLKEECDNKLFEKCLEQLTTKVKDKIGSDKKKLNFDKLNILQKGIKKGEFIFEEKDLDLEEKLLASSKQKYKDLIEKSGLDKDLQKYLIENTDDRRYSKDSRAIDGGAGWGNKLWFSIWEDEHEQIIKEEVNSNNRRSLLRYCPWLFVLVCVAGGYTYLSSKFDFKFRKKINYSNDYLDNQKLVNPKQKRGKWNQAFSQ